MNIVYLSLALLTGSALYNYGDAIQSEITSIWARIMASDDPGVLFTVAMVIWGCLVLIWEVVKVTLALYL